MIVGKFGSILIVFFLTYWYMYVGADVSHPVLGSQWPAWFFLMMKVQLDTLLWPKSSSRKRKLLNHYRKWWSECSGASLNSRRCHKEGNLFSRRKANWSHLDWTHQHDHWMFKLFPRTVLLYVLWTYWWAFGEHFCKLKRVCSMGRIHKALEYPLWGDVYIACPFTSYAGSSVFG